MAKLLVEGLTEKNLRKILVDLNADAKLIKEWRTLRLLDLILKLSSIAEDAGLQLSEDSAEVWRRYSEVDRFEERPVGALFLLTDLRNVKAHGNSNPRKEALKHLESFGILPAHVASGCGRALDQLFDALIETVETASETILASAR